MTRGIQTDNSIGNLFVFPKVFKYLNTRFWKSGSLKLLYIRTNVDFPLPLFPIIPSRTIRTRVVVLVTTLERLRLMVHIWTTILLLVIVVVAVMLRECIYTMVMK